MEWVKGAKKFADEVGLADRHDIMLSEGDSQKQISQVQAFIAKAGKDAVMSIDPNLPPDTAPLVKICQEAGADFFPQRNPPAGIVLGVQSLPREGMLIAIDAIANPRGLIPPRVRDERR